MQKEPGNTPKLWVGAKEAAAILGVNVKTVYKAIEAGQLASMRIGDRILIPRSVVEPKNEQPAGIDSEGAAGE